MRERVAKEGPLTFRDFMQLALYHPEHGYYARGKPWEGRGDFATASAYSPLLAHALAQAHLLACGALGLRRSELVEVGAGSGLLLRQLGEALRGQAARLRAVEVRRPAELPEGAVWSASLGGLEVEGSVVSNELFDALPVHRVARAEQGPEEAYVTVRGERLAWELGPLSTPALAEHVRGTDLVGGEAVAVCLDAAPMVRDMARALRRGIVVTVDYGGDGPQTVVAAYRRHRLRPDLLAEPGEQDLTAHVDFSMLRRLGEDAGLVTLAELPQWRFLGSMGALDELAAGKDALAALRAKTLLAPGRMGDFRVLVQGAGLGEAERARLAARFQQAPG